MFTADKTFVNGVFYTMEQERETVGAVVVHDGKFLFAGPAEEALKIPAKQVIDLKGKSVLPGMIDTHCHMSEVAEARVRVDLRGAKSIEEVLALMKERLPDVKPGQWLVGYQVASSSLKEKRLPNRYDLDQVSADVPVYVSSSCLHNFMGNSRVLALAGIDRSFDCPEISLLDRDESGEPTGIFREHGLLKYVNRRRPPAYATYEDAKKALNASLKGCAAMGYTTLHTFDGFTSSLMDNLFVYQQLEQEGALPMRVVLNRETGAGNSIGAISGLGSEKVKYGAVKFFTDGSVAERGAYLSEPYSDAPGTRGRMRNEPRRFAADIRAAYEEGNDVAVHVIGDGGMDLVLDILEGIRDPARPTQFRVIHATVTRPDQVARLAKLPATIDVQPAFMPSLGTVSLPRLGPRRMTDVMAYRSMTDAGLTLTGGTDAPIGTQNPFEGIRFSVLREVHFGADEIFLPQERISVYEAVSMFTKNAARCAHEENLKGTISAGKLADFIVLDRDVFNVPPQEISETKVLATYLGGSPTALRET